MTPKKDPDPLDGYRRVRKRVPPPGRPIPDRRRKAQEEMARREEREDREDRER
ncbi:MAG TPA: hypothetical protein VEA19_04110 [Actinomycetota bacterium]|nr:hypothetical protein [Actinomycetota bacterium]